MAIRASRIAWVGVAAIAMAVLWLWQNARERPAPVDPSDTPWIGLPRSGMDATQEPTRKLLRRAFGYGSMDMPNHSLAARCGIDGNEPPYEGKKKDRYIARIGASAFQPAWKIVMDVDGNNIDITWSYRDDFPPPPPPPSDRDWPTMVLPASKTQKSRAEMEPIRKLWTDQTLWHAPQDADALNCLDGDPVFLEACVNGQYAARLRNCSMPAFKATDQLWRGFNAILPPPPKPEWRDAAGNPVPDPSSD
jgi:hypothetical protein